MYIYIHTIECMNASLLCTGGRKLMDIRSKQQQSLEQQRLAAREAEHLHLDMMGRKTEARVQVGEREGGGRGGGGGRGSGEGEGEE